MILQKFKVARVATMNSEYLTHPVFFSAWQHHITAIPISADYSQMPGRALWLAVVRFFSQHDTDLLAKVPY